MLKLKLKLHMGIYWNRRSALVGAISISALLLCSMDMDTDMAFSKIIIRGYVLVFLINK
jgi:hypothetical protein